MNQSNEKRELNFILFAIGCFLLSVFDIFHIYIPVSPDDKIQLELLFAPLFLAIALAFFKVIENLIAKK